MSQFPTSPVSHNHGHYNINGNPKNMITEIKGFLITPSVKRAGLLSPKLAHANFKVSLLFLFTCYRFWHHFATRMGISLSFRPLDRFFSLFSFILNLYRGFHTALPMSQKYSKRINNFKKLIKQYP